MRNHDLKKFSEEVKKGFVEALGDKSSFNRNLEIKELKLKANTALFWGDDAEDVLGVGVASRPSEARAIVRRGPVGIAINQRREGPDRPGGPAGASSGRVGTDRPPSAPIGRCYT